MDYRENASPPEPDRSIVVVALDGAVYGLARDTGEVVWSNNLPGGSYKEVFIAIGYGVVVASAVGNKIFCLDYLTGATRWEHETTSSGRASIIIEPDCIVCVKRGYVDCFAPDGSVRWQQGMKGAGMGSAAIGLPGNVAQGDDVGRE
jgi:outer membrane protein assembly factor BamB